MMTLLGQIALGIIGVVLMYLIFVCSILIVHEAGLIFLHICEKTYKIIVKCYKSFGGVK